MGVADIIASRAEEQEDGLHLYGENFTRWSKVFVNGSRVPTTYKNSKELLISSDSLAEGANSLVVNQMSSDTIFRSSNEISYQKLLTQTEDAAPNMPIDDTTEDTPNSTDKAINGNRSRDESEF